MKYLVIDIGGTFTKYAVMDENAAFYEKGKIPTAKESEEGFLHMIEELYERYRDDADDALNPKKLLAETAGAPALIRLAAEETGIPVEELDGEKVFDMAQNGDERVLKALRRYTRRIAAHIMNCQFMGYMQACMGPHFSELDRSSVLEPAPDKGFMPLDDGDRFDLGGLHIDAYAMPGHTPGCMVFLIRELRTLILGDACNNSTFLFDDDAGYLDEYAGMLRNLRDRLTGTYDHVYLSHHDMETGTDIMDNVLEVCREAAEEKADDIPYDFMGHHAFIAKKCDERFRREDGKCGNIIYSKEKLFKKC